MSYINKPLDVIYLSERTMNALMKKNNIHTTNNLRAIRDKINGSYFSKKSLKGIGIKGMKEIVNAIYIISEDFYREENNDLGKKTNEEDEIKEQEKLKMEDFSNPHFYISIKRNNINGSYNQRHERKRPLNDYMLSIYKGDEIFNLEIFINIFIQTLSEVEIYVLKNRLLFLENHYTLPLSEIAKMGDITHERVRQIENSLLKKIKDTFTDLSNTEIGINLKKYILEDNKINDYSILDFSEHKKNYINGRFLAYIHANILSEEYDYNFLNKENVFGDIVLVYKKDLIDKKTLNKFFANIDRIYKEERPEDKKIIKDVLIGKITKDLLKTYLKNSGYEYCIFKYLGNIYNIFQVHGIFTLPQNRKDLKFLVKKELELLEEPIHFKKMYELVLEKYPEYKRNYGKVHSALMKCGKNVGNGLYVKGNHHMQGGTIGDITEAYLKEIGTPTTFSEVLNYIKKNRIVKNSSIETVLFDQDKQQRFVRIEGGKIGLLEWRPTNIVTARKIYKLDEEIYEFLKKNKISEFTANEIIEKIGKNLSYQRTMFALNKLVENGKIAFLTKGITNYYYVL